MPVNEFDVEVWNCNKRSVDRRRRPRGFDNGPPHCGVATRFVTSYFDEERGEFVRIYHCNRCGFVYRKVCGQVLP